MAITGHNQNASGMFIGILNTRIGFGVSAILHRNKNRNKRSDAHLKQLTPFSSAIVQELCESRGGRPGLSVLMSLLVSVDVKIYCTVLRHWSQLVPNMSHDI